MKKRISRLVLLSGALCCLLPSARAQTSDIEIERQSNGTYFAACQMPGLGRLTIRQLENGEFDLYINSPQESEELEPIKGQRQVTVALELENLALISNALVLVVPEETSLFGYRFGRLCLYYPAWQKQKGRHEASLYFSDDSGETRVRELASPEYMKLLATRDIEKIHVNVGSRTVCVMEAMFPTAATFRAMCREIGDRIGDHSFYGETASSAPAHSETSSAGADHWVPIVFSSVKEMIDRPFGLLKWGMNRREAKELLDRQSSWPFYYLLDGAIIKTAKDMSAHPRYCRYLGLEGHCSLGSFSFSTTNLTYNFYSSSLGDVVTAEQAIIRELEAMNVKMTRAKDCIYQYVSGSVRPDGEVEKQFFNHKSYEVNIYYDKDMQESSVRLSVIHSPFR